MSSLCLSSRTQKQKPKNPFTLPPAAELFSHAEEAAIKRQNEREKLSSLSLAERVEQMQCPVPPCRTQRTKVRAVSKAESAISAERRAKTARNQRTTEFITEKREIYLTQLLIDKKTKEISKINKIINENNAKLQEKNEEAALLDEKIKLATQHIEATLSRGIRDAEQATQKRVEVNKKLRFQRNRVDVLRSELTKNKDALDTYKEYYQFMEAVVPDGAKQKDFYNDFNLIPDSFDKIQHDNLFIQIQCQRIEEMDSRGIDNAAELLRQKERIVESLENQISSIKPIENVTYEIAEGTTNEAEATVKEIDQLKVLVNRVYERCFGEKSSESAMTMLTRIEDSLNQMYEDISYVDKTFVAKSMYEINQKRRNEQRRKAQMDKDRALAEKKEQALKRAARPIKEKTGRPLMVRTVPRRKNVRDDAREKALIRKRKQMENLLFGPTFDE